MLRIAVVLAVLFVALTTGHPTTESPVNTTTVPSNTFPGPCPNLTTIADLDVARFHTFWYKVYASYFHGEPLLRCSRANLTVVPDNSSSSIVSLFRGILEGQSEPTGLNVTLTPINDFPGTFNVSYDIPEGFFPEYQQKDVRERRSYILDTDYDTYIYSGCCYGDGLTYHKISSGVLYYEKQIPSEAVTAAYDVFRRYEFPLNLNPIDQGNCTSVQFD